MISDGIEVDVEDGFDGVVDALDEVDQRTAAIFDELNKDDLLVTKDVSLLNRDTGRPSSRRSRIAIL